jgi:hypothetical protein
MTNIFLVAYLAALLPSVIALAWFIWRAPTLDQISERRSFNAGRGSSTRRQIRHRSGRLAETGHWPSVNAGRARINEQPHGARQ